MRAGPVLDLMDEKEAARGAVHEFLHWVRNVGGRSASSSVRYTTLGLSIMLPMLW